MRNGEIDVVDSGRGAEGLGEVDQSDLAGALSGAVAGLLGGRNYLSSLTVCVGCERLR